ncbi:MAG: DUF3810 family protein, partial [Acidobacteriota bacterium]|nr:DUF3810 family protein [Acidobacteriota bacterium]
RNRATIANHPITNRAMSQRLPASLVVAALVAFWFEAPAWVVQRYAASLYPWLQASITPLSNRSALPLFDLGWTSTLAGVATAGLVATRRAWRKRRFQPLGPLAMSAATVAAVFYLWFLVAWGFNYRRPGVETEIHGFQPGRATPAAVRGLAERAVRESNRLHDRAHARGFPALDEVPPALVASLHAVERELGRDRPTAPSRPKRPLTAPYMRAVGVSGMLAPLFLETYLNPDLTGPERPYVLAHEWAHLSGFAPEEDASFVGVVTALRADVASSYSAWLYLVSESAMRLQPVTRQLVLEGLAAGPRADLDAVAVRLRSRVPWLDRASWVAYDRAIKSQGADSGVAGYGRVIELLLGSGVVPEEAE